MLLESLQYYDVSPRIWMGARLHWNLSTPVTLVISSRTLMHCWALAWSGIHSTVMWVQHSSLVSFVALCLCLLCLLQPFHATSLTVLLLMYCVHAWRILFPCAMLHWKWINIRKLVACGITNYKCALCITRVTPYPQCKVQVYLMLGSYLYVPFPDKGWVAQESDMTHNNTPKGITTATSLPVDIAVVGHIPGDLMTLIVCPPGGWGPTQAWFSISPHFTCVPRTIPVVRC